MLVLPQLAVAALSANVEIVGEVASERILSIYESERWLDKALIESTPTPWWRPGGRRWPIRWSDDSLRVMANCGGASRA